MSDFDYFVENVSKLPSLIQSECNIYNRINIRCISNPADQLSIIFSISPSFQGYCQSVSGNIACHLDYWGLPTLIPTNWMTNLFAEIFISIIDSKIDSEKIWNLIYDIANRYFDEINFRPVLINRQIAKLQFKLFISIISNFLDFQFNELKIKGFELKKFSEINVEI